MKRKAGKLPKGIYYEAARNRFRVRLYDKQAVKSLSYHSTLEEAEACLAFLKSGGVLAKHVPRPPAPEKPVRVRQYPMGLCYAPSMGYYRVSLTLNRRVIWNTYHKTEDDALRAHASAIHVQNMAKALQ